MPDYTIIDAHVHTYPSCEIGRQAMMGSGRTDYGGTPDELLAIMDGAGIRQAVMVNMTPVADMRDAALAKLPPNLSPAQRTQAEADIDRQLIGRLQRRNQWTCQVAREHPRLVPFIGLDPCMSEAELLQEVEARHSEGAAGIKLHPAAQRFYPDDRRLFPVYDRAQALGLPIIYHSGAFVLGPNPSDHAHPRRFPDVLAAFPRLTVVLGHAGFGDFAACGELARQFPNVFFDCCAVINGTEPSPTLSDGEAAAAIRLVGADRIMFGSDYPWFDPALDAARLQRLPLADPEKRAVLYDNAVRILRLEDSPGP
ncbi:MAG TPA: amidohydrolase family protein [Dehalococcoidia bacterium]|nr:amidohydrolase family protein [Dehalococcoidia bacterium]